MKFYYRVLAQFIDTISKEYYSGSVLTIIYCDYIKLHEKNHA